MKLIDIKENITPRQRLVLLFTILILVIVTFSFMKNFFSKKEGIDYKNIDYNNFIVESSETSDRNLYWTLNDILVPFLQSYQTVEKMDTSELIEYKYTGRSLEDYYDALDKNYKKYLGKEEFISKSKEMMSKVFEKNDKGFVIKNENSIVKDTDGNTIVFDQQILSDENQWSYTWNDLSSRYTWNVVETTVPEGYTESSIKEGNTVVLTNTSTTPVIEEKPTSSNQLPLTGQLQWPIPVLVIAGIMFLIIGKACRKYEE